MVGKGRGGKRNSQDQPQNDNNGMESEKKAAEIKI
jgi:hypothetical protein